MLRIASFAAMYGGNIALDRLRDVIGVTTHDLQRALKRLLDEHLIRSVDSNEISGLHALRSGAITDVIHRLPPQTLEVTSQQAFFATSESSIRDLLEGAIGTKTIATRSDAISLNVKTW